MLCCNSVYYSLLTTTHAVLHVYRHVLLHAVYLLTTRPQGKGKRQTNQHTQDNSPFISTAYMWYIPYYYTCAACLQCLWLAGKVLYDAQFVVGLGWHQCNRFSCNVPVFTQNGDVPLSTSRTWFSFLWLWGSTSGLCHNPHIEIWITVCSRDVDGYVHKANSDMH